MSSKRILAILLGAFVLGLFIVGIGCGVTIQEFKDIKTEPLKENYLFNSVTMNVPEKNSDIYIDFSDYKIEKDDSVEDNTLVFDVESYGYAKVVPTITNNKYLVVDSQKSPNLINLVDVDCENIGDDNNSFGKYMEEFKNKKFYHKEYSYKVTIKVNSRDFSRIKVLNDDMELVR